MSAKLTADSLTVLQNQQISFFEEKKWHTETKKKDIDVDERTRYMFRINLNTEQD